VTTATPAADCTHNTMVANGAPGFPWRCTCGYVYGGGPSRPAPAAHRTRYGETLNVGDVVRIEDDGDCGLLFTTRRRLAQVLRPGPITILNVEGVGIRSCIDEYLLPVITG
jgi:hypothetical protein